MTKQEEIVLMELDWSNYKICSVCGKLKRANTEFYHNLRICKPCRIQQVNSKRKKK